LFALAVPGYASIVVATGVTIELAIKTAAKIKREPGYITGGE
jgi:hypothetical protein